MVEPTNIEEQIHADELTWREQEVLNLLAERMTNREIADRLSLAESTVKDYVSKILNKLYVNNRREAVEKALALRIIGSGDSFLEDFKSNLPAESIRFIGRNAELKKIKQIFENSRLITLTGPGGIGKTHLAIKTARELEGDFNDGAFFVALAPARSMGDIIQAISEATGFPGSTPEPALAQLLRNLKNRHILLILDNFEHLLGEVSIVQDILQNAAGVKILITSQERMNLQSETVFNIDGMGVSGSDGGVSENMSDAVALFLVNAKKVQPDYKPDQDQIHTITGICETVNGVPLAIELAASWLHVLTVDEIASELELGFDILETEARDVPGRHRSIRTVFDHSWTLLSDRDRELFKSLAIFQGGFTLQAAVSVSGANFKQIAGLVDKSFIRHDPQTGRYEIHELLRQYAMMRIESAGNNLKSIREAHAAFFAEFMQSNWSRLRSSDQLSAIKEIEADISNIRTAWEYSISQLNPKNIREFLDSLWFIYLVNGWYLAASELFGEAASALQEVIEDDESRALMALAMGLKGYFMAWLGLPGEGYDLSMESERILLELDRPLDQARVLDGLSLNSYYLSRMDEEKRVMYRMGELAADLQDDSLLAYSLFLRSLISIREKNLPQATEQANNSLQLFESMGDAFYSTFPLLSLGGINLTEKNYSRSREYFERCLDISEQFNFRWSIENASKYLGILSLSLNEIEAAERYLHRSLEISRETGLGREKANLLYEYAVLRTRQNRKGEAVELLTLVLQVPESSLARIEGGSIHDKCSALLARLKDDLPPGDFSRASDKGRHLEQNTVIERLLLEKTRGI